MDASRKMFREREQIERPWDRTLSGWLRDLKKATVAGEEEVGEEG